MAGWKSKRRVMQQYDLTADMYEERYREEQQAKYKASLENVDVAGSIVLDVGCGTGLFFSQVADQVRMVLGVDFSRKLLLKAKNQAKKFSNAFVLRADVDYLPFSEGFFDAVFAFTVLQNMPEPSETLNELKRVAKPGGSVVVTGLKKAFPMEAFMNVLERTSMRVASFLDIEDLKCYVAVLTAQ
ncbi:MAG TPA: class I SAM-dependent methyltransferase [Candidatus Limnocylindrales bacterium]|nr:class I SAM-dependent methyltransferase [Candidatus Limnocylindrales bacterium]